MPYTAAQLSAYYQALTGSAPVGADAVLINAYATQSQNGTLSDTNALLGVFNSAGVQGSFEAAESTYQFFNAGVSGQPAGLSQGGVAFYDGYLTGTSATNISSFNTENRYYNLAISAASAGSAGNANFVSTYGGLTFAQTVSTAYETIVGSANVGTAAANAAIADIISRQSYFTSVANSRAGGIDAGGAAGQNIALKAIVIGYILEEANKADVGTYAKAIDQLEAAVAATSAPAPYAVGGINSPYGVNVVTTFGSSGSGFNTGFQALGANANAQTNFALTTGIDAPNLNTGSVNYIGTVNVSGNGSNVVNPSTLQAGDQIKATGANNTLTITTIGSSPNGVNGANGGAVDATGGAVISGVQTIDIRAVGDPNTGTAGAASFNASGNAANGGQGNVTGATALYAYLSPGAVTFNNVSTQATGIINDGITTGGSLTANYVSTATTAVVNLAGGTTAGETVTVSGAGLITLNVNSNGGLNTLGGGAAGATGITVTGNTVTTLNLAATSSLVLNGIADTALTTVTGSGVGTINAGTINSAVSKIDTTGLTGSFTATFTAAPTSTTAYNLGAGNDNLTFGTAAANVNLASGTNVNLGQGTNAFIVNGSFGNTANSTTTSSIIGGTMGDTIVVTGTLGQYATINSSGGGDTIQVGTVNPGATVNGGGGAVFLTGNADFAAISTGAGFTTAQRGQITGFSTIGITDALQTATYDINAVGAQNFTTDGVATGQTATLNANTGAVVTFANNVGTNGTGGNLSGNTGTLNIALANSATNANDILNLGFTGQPAGNETSTINVASTTSSTGVAQGVETINVTAVGTTTNATNIQLNLVDAALTNISFAGNESITYAPVAAHTVLKVINGAADTGTLVVDATALNSTGASPVTITTGSGNDIVFVKDFDQVTTGGVTGGTGFNTITVATTSSGQTYSTVMDAKVGDHINFGAGSGAAGVTSTMVNTTKLTLNTSTAVFQDYLDTAHNATTAGGVIGFDYQGNTYLVEHGNEMGTGNTYQPGQDSVIKLIGIHTFTASGGTAILAS